MDYVEWCDSIAVAMASYAEHHDRWINLHQFAANFVSTRPQLDGAAVQNAVILDSAEMLSVCGISTRSQAVELKRVHIDQLRNNYDRWTYAQMIPLDDLDLLLLGSLNRLSQRIKESYTTVHHVDLGTIVAEVGHGPDGVQVDTDHAEEQLDYLKNRGLARSHKTMGLTEYKSSYLGVARTNRAHVAQDQEIDQLRTEGEGDTLDYKRYYKLGTESEKRELTKDVTALANAGGSGPRLLLLGVEDNGEFYRPASVDEEKEHRAHLAETTETRVQQIVTSRTTHSPSIRVVARGNHRDGPYLLIEIRREVSHLPYRIYRNQTERTSPNAHEGGEVWIRKGSTKALATDAEITALEQQASLFQRLRTSK